ncbi:lipoprotein [Pseudomonas sp. QTF5]|uniref:Lipoprotein LppL n=2 Tax=Pseudomonas TaxID=286 RepID=A0A0L1MI18_PSESX|nr:lipoprotein [Pseudomonas sp. QTF5]KNH28147.1 lipoprotein LppL [Pseudomonas syringae]
MKRLISSLAALASLVAFVSLLSACGQKGPLYLPDENQDPAEQAKSSQQQPASKAHKHDVY